MLDQQVDRLEDKVDDILKTQLAIAERCEKNSKEIQHHADAIVDLSYLVIELKKQVDSLKAILSTITNR